ncbi:ABC-type nitrate/sulfonate/bicarbonate transport system ATPase subunit [Allocatelliglobosispora scoriae]|uniref:ABC-type nitrate/sulfonate/bicarbonate transport system ATPase subunit n=1 Tax=Allocatelliglobosispora scoriae TaxID=643052 RepID=A0A841BM94_9ACTN|nr:ABC transporter ATP-binding protein [Allocatelliglobosispora scoriae]MBB5867981.1 ABC-type nitrate/sulfonate/bicarbonate transport system ATPase subunit [Allocatelliglobosispora scoriae]
MPSRPDEGSAVALRSVTHRYSSRGRHIDALHTLDLSISAGEFVVVVGPSGCGKSTLLGLIAGFHRPTTGTVQVDGAPVVGPGPDRGVVFQQPRLFPWLSVLGNVEFGLRGRGISRADRRARALAKLDQVGLADVAGLRPYELSGGMQQRAAIARALAPDPGVLLMDEPFAALDALTRDRMQEELRALWRDTGRTVLFVTHSIDEAVYLGTRIIVFSARPGRVVLDEASDIPAQGRDRDHPDFGTLRTRISTAVRSAAAP